MWIIQREKLSSILNCCNVKSVSSKKDPNDLSLRDIHIDSFFTTTRKCFLRINMQLINLDYDDMKNLTYILISCKWFQIVWKKKEWKALCMWDYHI